jgi:hypothetical protein
MNSMLLKIAIVAGIGIFLIWMFRKSQPVAELLCATFGIDPDEDGPIQCKDGKIIPVEAARTEDSRGPLPESSDELTPEQLAFNRAGKRFRVTVGNGG